MCLVCDQDLIDTSRESVRGLRALQVWQIVMNTSAFDLQSAAKGTRLHDD